MRTLRRRLGPGEAKHEGPFLSPLLLGETAVKAFPLPTLGVNRSSSQALGGERSEHLNRTPAPIASRVRAQVSCSRSTISKIMTRLPSARSTGPTFPIGRLLRNTYRRLRTFRSFRAASPKKVLRIVSPLGSRLGHRAPGNERTWAPEEPD